MRGATKQSNQQRESKQNLPPRLVQLRPLLPVFLGLAKTLQRCRRLFSLTVFALRFSAEWKCLVCHLRGTMPHVCQAFVAVALALWRTMSKLQHLLFQSKPHLVRATITCWGWARAWWIHIFRLYLPFSLSSSFIHTHISGSYNVYPKVASFFFFFFLWRWGHKSDSLVAQQHLPVLKCAI